MPSTHKKVIVRKMDRDSVSGYVAPAQFVEDGKLELLNTAGSVVGIDLREIKGVYFVREGLMPVDLLQSIPEGYLVNPPDQRSNTQRIFVPRTALDSLTVLAVIGATRRQRKGGPSDARQVPMFEE